MMKPVRDPCWDRQHRAPMKRFSEHLQSRGLDAMLDVTEAACAQLQEMLDEAVSGKGFSDEITLRLIWENDELRFMQDIPRDGDEQYEHNDRVVLVVDPRLSEVLDENILDAANGSLSLGRQGD